MGLVNAAITELGCINFDPWDPEAPSRDRCVCRRHSLTRSREVWGLRQTIRLSYIDVFDGEDPSGRRRNHHTAEWCDLAFHEPETDADLDCRCGKHKLAEPNQQMNLVWIRMHYNSVGWNVREVISEWHRNTSACDVKSTASWA